MFGLALVSAFVSTSVLVTLKFQANIHPPLATSPHPVGLSASSAKTSTGQKTMHCTIEEISDELTVNLLLAITEMKQVHSSEMSATLYQAPRCYNPKRR